MIFTVGLVAIFVLVVIIIFAYQKLYNPGRLCNVCYRVVPNLSPQCPFCDSELKWDD
ncbi:MAG TPA: hypothetical protein QGI59_03770 [Candidatus Poseidoniia archaeon]|jgi:predicted amidophosphoribosyltransferase|nr:hypothetical protein [Candidatus Poseidoniia archaeon]